MSTGPRCAWQYLRNVCLMMVAFATGGQAATLPAGFTETLIATGLTNPTAMEFAPDGRLFVCEQGGQLRVIKNGALLRHAVRDAHRRTQQASAACSASPSIPTSPPTSSSTSTTRPTTPPFTTASAASPPTATSPCPAARS